MGDAIAYKAGNVIHGVPHRCVAFDVSHRHRRVEGDDALDGCSRRSRTAPEIAVGERSTRTSSTTTARC
jgi:hypothetical protein